MSERDQYVQKLVDAEIHRLGQALVYAREVECGMCREKEVAYLRRQIRVLRGDVSERYVYRSAS